MISFIEESLQDLKKKKLDRFLTSVEEKKGCRITIKGKSFLDFSSNDYLGLSCHPKLKKKAQEFLETYGVGSRASRLISGNLCCFEEIEKKIALLKKTEAALLLNSGYQANITLIPALCNSASLLLVDRLAHNSILQGALLSRSKLFRYRHNDLSHLEKLLKKHAPSYSRIFVITESVFSMDGDSCDLDKLLLLAKQYDAFVYVDEAHATGIFGKEGGGLCVGKPIDLVMGTFSKAFGGFGAYAACSKALKEYLINFCSGFIFSTALPPPVLGAIDAALDLIPSMGKEREKLFKNAKKVCRELKSQGWRLTSTTSPIIPLIVGTAANALLLYQKLLEKGIFAMSIRPPTVEIGSSRIRIALSALHGNREIDYLLATLSSLSRDFL